MSPLRHVIIESGKYLAASAVAFAADLALLTLLVGVGHWDYRPAAACSFIAGGVVLYVLSVTFVFPFRRVPNRSLELPCFIGLGLIGLVVNLGAMFVAVDALHLPIVSAKMLAAGCTFGINFFLRRLLLFTPAVQPERP